MSQTSSAVNVDALVVWSPMGQTACHSSELVSVDRSGSDLSADATHLGRGPQHIPSFHLSATAAIFLVKTLLDLPYSMKSARNVRARKADAPQAT